MNSPTKTPDPATISLDVKAHEPDAGLWTTREVATFLRISLKTVFNLRKKGLPYVNLGGAVRFVPQEIRDYLVNSRRSSSHRQRQMIRKGVTL